MNKIIDKSEEYKEQLNEISKNIRLEDILKFYNEEILVKEINKSGILGLDPRGSGFDHIVGYEVLWGGFKIIRNGIEEEFNKEKIKNLVKEREHSDKIRCSYKFKLYCKLKKLGNV